MSIEDGGQLLARRMCRLVEHSLDFPRCAHRGVKFLYDYISSWDMRLDLFEKGASVDIAKVIDFWTISFRASIDECLVDRIEVRSHSETKSCRVFVIEINVKFMTREKVRSL